MIGCTAEELTLLNNMVDVIKHNVNHSTALLWANSGVSTTCGDLRVICNKNIPAFLPKEINEALQRIFRYIIPNIGIGEREEFEKKILNAPLDDMPMYINRNDTYGLVAIWRLRIGK